MPRKVPLEKSLSALFPSVAAQACEWDPACFSAHSHQTMKWRCDFGHEWNTQIYNRTSGGKGCPYCSGRYVLTGINDLQTLRPEIAFEALGWNPAMYSCGSSKKKEWLCQCGYQWCAQIHKRAISGQGCPKCAGKVITVGKNDLASQYPRIAKEACGWNPETVSRMSDKVLKWRCEKEHEWMASVKNRTLYDSRCPICIKKILLPGVNDLESQFPAIAAQSHGWDPSHVRYGSDKKKEWLCPCGNVFNTSPNNRTNPSNGTGCPACAPNGYNPNKDGWLYLVMRQEERKIGITNVPNSRLTTHKRNGWILLEKVGPINGSVTLKIESHIKRWLRDEKMVLPSTYENWMADRFDATSIYEVAAAAGVDQTLLDQLR